MSYADLIPNELQEELIVLRDAHTRIDFRTGDVVTLIMDFNHDNQVAVHVMEVYAAVGAFVGRSARTVRDYHTVAAFYSHEVRQQYGMLAFDHFRQAMVLGPEWERALQWAILQVDELGRPATVDAMAAQFSAIDNTLQPPESGEPQEEGEGDGDDEPGESPANQVRAALLTLHRCVPQLTLNPGDRGQAEEALLVLDELLVTAS